MHERTGSGLSQADEATELLRNRILDLTLQPGSRIEEAQIQALLSIGRTPIREGINRLISEGLLELREGRGVYVAPLDLVTLVMLFEAYAASERLAAYFCRFEDENLVGDVRRMQDEQLLAFRQQDYLRVSYWSASFRTRIAQSSGNRYIHDFCRRMNNQVRRITYFVWTNEAIQDAAPPPRAMEDLQQAILGALIDHDREGLVHELDAQVEILRQRTLRILSQSRAPKFTPGKIRQREDVER